jgi:group II intron reverse transcriptase/maturase
MASISLQDLKRRLYDKAKAEKAKRFWGLYVHVAKLETLRTAYEIARKHNGAPGIDGVTFAAIEASGVEGWLAQLRDELVTRTYRPLRNRRVEIPKRGGKVRVLGIPAIRDRVVQGALKLIMEPIFEADFCEGSYGYRPQRTAHEAVARVAQAIVSGKTRVIDLDLAAYFDTVRPDVLLGKVARRIQDGEILHLLRLMLKASGHRGVPQGGVISPLLANIYLTEVDAMLERAKEVTRDGKWMRVEYARYADDLVILVDGYRRHAWLLKAVDRRLREELAKLDLRLNEAKSRIVDLERGEAFGFLLQPVTAAFRPVRVWSRCPPRVPCSNARLAARVTLLRESSGRKPSAAGERCLSRSDRSRRASNHAGRSESEQPSDASKRTLRQKPMSVERGSRRIQELWKAMGAGIHRGYGPVPPSGVQVAARVKGVLTQSGEGLVRSPDQVVGQDLLYKPLMGEVRRGGRDWRIGP